MNGRPIRIWPILGKVDWWWLVIAAFPEFAIRQLFRVPAWVPELSLVWCFLQAALKQAEPRSKALNLYAAAFVTQSLAAMPARHGVEAILLLIARLLSVALWIVAIFVFRDEMKNHFNVVDPRDLELSGVMTFFFSTLYFQYWFRELYREQTETSLSLLS